MCVHADQKFSPAQLAELEREGLHHLPYEWEPAEIWPGKPALISVGPPGLRWEGWHFKDYQWAIARFGFRMDRPGKRKPVVTSWLHNARMETIGSKPTWRTRWQAGQRCVVPVRRWFEPREAGGEWDFRVRAESITYLAALWERSPVDGELCMSLVTVTPPKEIEQYHDRMPLVLSRARAITWMKPETPPYELANWRNLSQLEVAPALLEY